MCRQQLSHSVWLNAELQSYSSFLCWKLCFEMVREIYGVKSNGQFMSTFHNIKTIASDQVYNIRHCICAVWFDTLGWPSTEGSRDLWTVRWTQYPVFYCYTQAQALTSSISKRYKLFLIDCILIHPHNTSNESITVSVFWVIQTCTNEIKWQ